MTKAKTVAAKKRGRKRKAGQREPSGKLARTTSSRRSAEQRRPAMEARKRQYGLSDEDALSQEAGSLVGRLCLSGELSRPQFEAAEVFERTSLAYRTAIDVPDRLKAGHGGMDDGEYEQWCAAAISRYREMVGILRNVDIEHRGTMNSLGVLQALVLRDTITERQFGDARVALNALSRWSKKIP